MNFWGKFFLLFLCVISSSSSWSSSLPHSPHHHHFLPSYKKICPSNLGWKMTNHYFWWKFKLFPSLFSFVVLHRKEENDSFPSFLPLYSFFLFVSSRREKGKCSLSIFLASNKLWTKNNGRNKRVNEWREEKKRERKGRERERKGRARQVSQSVIAEDSLSKEDLEFIFGPRGKRNDGKEIRERKDKRRKEEETLEEKKGKRRESDHKLNVVWWLIPCFLRRREKAQI